MSGSATQFVYRPTAARRLRAAGALIFVLVLVGTQIAWSMVGIGIVGGLWPGPDGWEWVYDVVDTLLVLARLVAVIVTAVVFIQWQRSVTHNLHVIGAAVVDPSVTLSTWGWFIPVGNLYIPCASMLQIARRSVPYGERPAVALVGAWWASWLTAYFVAAIGNSLQRRAETAEPWITAVTVAIIADAIFLLAAALAIQLVGRLTRQQQARLSVRSPASA